METDESYTLKKQCCYCDAEIPLYAPQKYCSKIECRQKWYKEKQREGFEHREKLAGRLKEKEEKIKQKWAAQNGADADRVPIVEVPYGNKDPYIIDDDRIDEFRLFIEELIESLDKVDEEKKFKSPFKTPDATKLNDALGSMCALCTGHCCRQGRGQNAFIQRSTLIRVLSQNSEISKEELLALYLGYIPEIAMEESCIYHTPRGCSLPSHLRADICGEFFCKSLDEYIKHYGENDAPATNIAFSVEDFEIKRISVISKEGELKRLELET